jgi:hypothetical protein
MTMMTTMLGSPTSSEPEEDKAVVAVEAMIKEGEDSSQQQYQHGPSLMADPHQ